MRFSQRSLPTIVAAAVMAVAGLAQTSPALAQVKLDPKLPSYKPVAGVSGSIKGVGSDTMNNLMTLWAEGFRKFYPAVRIEVEGKGSNTAVPALINGTATFGPMSRELKQEEIDAFKKKFGWAPAQIATSIDMLAVYVNKDNPIKQLSLPQVDAIFSSTRKLGSPKELLTWGDAGLDGEWKSSPISLYGRNSASGTYGYFKEHALGKGDFRDTVKEQPGSPAVVQAVGSDKFGIGYSGIGVMTADVRALPLAKKEGGKAIAAEPEHAYNGDYPLSRPLTLTLNYNPKVPLEPLRREFVRFVLSKEGQEVVIKDGYLPVTSAMAKRALEQVGLK